MAPHGQVWEVESRDLIPQFLQWQFTITNYTSEEHLLNRMETHLIISLSIMARVFQLLELEQVIMWKHWPFTIQIYMQEVDIQWLVECLQAILPSGTALPGRQWEPELTLVFGHLLFLMLIYTLVVILLQRVEML